MFTLNEEAIYLTEFLGMEIRPLDEGLHETTRLDPEVTNKFLIYFRMLIESQGPRHVDELMEAVTKNYPRDGWINLFSNSHDLITFFKVHSNIFHVQVLLNIYTSSFEYSLTICSIVVAVAFPGQHSQYHSL